MTLVFLDLIRLLYDFFLERVSIVVAPDVLYHQLDHHLEDFFERFGLAWVRDEGLKARASLRLALLI